MEPGEEFRELERRLRRERPQPSEHLLDALLARLEAPARSPRPERRPRFRLGLAGALAAAALLVFAAVGGLGYARTAVGDSIAGAAGAVADVVAPKQEDVAARRALAQAARGAVPAGIASTQGRSGTGQAGAGQDGAQTTTGGGGGGGGGGPGWFAALNPGHWVIPPGDHQYGSRVAICITKRTPLGTIRVTLYVPQVSLPYWLSHGATLGPCRRP